MLTSEEVGNYDVCVRVKLVFGNVEDLKFVGNWWMVADYDVFIGMKLAFGKVGQR